jgi:serine/threonine-protein kinase HipA
MPKSDKNNPTVLEIWLNQIRVGTVTNLPYDQNLFVFDDDYIRANDRPVLSLSFYDENRNLIIEPEQVQTKVPPFFSNLLPEGRLREYLAGAAGIKHAREFFVLWLLGTDLPGAVLAQDSEGAPLPPEDPGAREKAKRRQERVLRFSCPTYCKALVSLSLRQFAVAPPNILRADHDDVFEQYLTGVGRREENSAP